MVKKLALGCLLIVALLGVVFYAAWRQATRLPDWYAETAPAPAAEAAPGESGVSSGAAPSAGEPAGGRAAAGPTPRVGAAARAAEPGVAGSAARPVPPSTPRAPRPEAAVDGLSPGRVELDERQLNELLARSLDEHPRGQRLKRAVKGMRASIDGDRLELGVVTSLAALGAAAESEREARAVDRLARLAPWLGDRDVYLALRGRPRARDGRLVFDRDGELRVGGITFDAADFAARLGVPEEKLDRGVELPLSGMTVEGVEVADGFLVLSLVDR